MQSRDGTERRLETLKQRVCRPPPARIRGGKRCRNRLRVAPPPSGVGIISIFINIYSNNLFLPLCTLLANMVLDVVYRSPMMYCVSLPKFE